MISRHCAKAALNFMKQTKTIRAITLRCSNAFPKNYGAIRELSNATCLSVIQRQTSYKNINRGNSKNVQNSKPEVIHDAIGKRFYIPDADGIGRAFLKYEAKGPMIKIMRTEVPKKLGGRGYGKLLAKEALDFVARNDYQVQIHCEFVRAFIKKHATQFTKYLK